jgi:uncharacterized Zn ribbon protein
MDLSRVWTQMEFFQAVVFIQQAVDESVRDANGNLLTCKVDGFGALNLKSEFVKKV